MDIRYKECERYKLPPALTIDNADSTSITLEQFIIKTHVCLSLHIEELKLAKGMFYRTPTRVTENGMISMTVGERYEPFLPHDIVFFFWKLWAMQVDQIVRSSIRVLAEGEVGVTADRFWAMQLKQAGHREQPREHLWLKRGTRHSKHLKAHARPCCSIEVALHVLFGNIITNTVGIRLIFLWRKS